MRSDTAGIASLLLAITVGASGAVAQGAPSQPADGLQIATKLCASCHIVDADGKGTARADVPPFKAIANGPHGAPERLAAAIILPHPEMPGIALTRAEIRAVIDYIRSLKTP
ncbi:MAG: c-type cytochrome [Hyphomicrobiaceae bacterium]